MPGFTTIFQTVMLLIGVTALAMGVVIIVTLLRHRRERRYNDRQPVLTVAASVVGRRTDVDVRRHHHREDELHTVTHSSYFATFQVESGDRLELQLTGEEYGLLAEGDQGRLTFQGERFLRFERD